MSRAKNPYAKYAIQDFIVQNFGNNQVLRAQITNLFDGVREQAYNEGFTAGQAQQTKKTQTQ